jgi:hypothetical protein
MNKPAIEVYKALLNGGDGSFPLAPYSPHIDVLDLGWVMWVLGMALASMVVLQMIH